MPAENIYYVYVYLDESFQPYYVGMGKDRRAFVRHQRGIEVPPKERIILAERNLTLTGAFAIERKLIRWFGREHLGGKLKNKEPGGCGYRDGEEQSQMLLELSANGKHQWQSDEHKKRISDWHQQRKDEGNHHLVKRIPVTNKLGEGTTIPVNQYNSQTGPKDQWEYVHSRSHEAARRKNKSHKKTWKTKRKGAAKAAPSLEEFLSSSYPT